MTAARDRMDRIAWETIKARPAMQRMAGYETQSRRPHDYAEVGERIAAGSDFEYVWSDFLHSFFLYRTADHLSQPSPSILNAHWRAVLAGSAEFLSAEFGLPHPAWTNAPEYFLSETWDPWMDFGIATSDMVEARLRRSPEAFRRRNIAFESRNLITL